MKDVAGYVLLAVSAAGVCGALGFLYGSLCALLAATREKIVHVRSVDCRLWTRAGPVMAVAVLIGANAERSRLVRGPRPSARWPWIAAASMRGGIYWSTTRRLARATE